MRSRLTLLWLICFASATAQTTHPFTEGLVVGEAHRYGRQAIVQDKLAYLLGQGELSRPAANEVAYRNDDDENVTWSAVSVDTAGRFRDEAMRNGYLYLTYEAQRPGSALLQVSGHSMLYFNGEPRGGDIYGDGWMRLPVALKRGRNEILIRCTNFSRWRGVEARLQFPLERFMVSADDPTLPHVILGSDNRSLLGGVVVINNTDKSVRNLTLRATVAGVTRETSVPVVGPLTVRKIGFTFDASGVTAAGDHIARLELRQGGRTVHETDLTLTAISADMHQSHTFRSDIDGSVQYYGVAPRTGTHSDRPALFLSVHGAAVEAIGQARAYQPKDWGVLVAPTNRRPRGFNWEDWGRIDALEVFEHAKQKFNPDPERIYLTGHSMGGHGTWYLGATYPDKWAAIAPCAGYPTLSAYGSADGRIPDSARADVERTLLRASNPSDVLSLASNYRHHGVYVFHGDADRVVSVRFARQMRGVLAKFHPDFAYYEYPGGSHWFGNESVDWPPLFDFFRHHTLKHDSAVHEVDFKTANPGISAKFRWASILQQEVPLNYSHIRLSRNFEAKTISGVTDNVARLKLALDGFDVGDEITITLDSVDIPYRVTERGEVYLAHEDGWRLSGAPDDFAKNPARYGTFKDPFNHNMVFVYGTSGNASENAWAYAKARYDAEVWYYRANGAVDVISDRVFDPAKYPDRGVILYGNVDTNTAWNKLLAKCPIRVKRNQLTAGGQSFEGNDLGAYFVWPRQDSDIASVGVVTGTGLPGMRAADANQYFAGGSGFPDYFIFSAEMLRSGLEGVRAAGFFSNDWKISNDQIVE